MRWAALAMLLGGCLTPESLGKDLADGGGSASSTDGESEAGTDGTGSGETGDGDADGTTEGGETGGETDGAADTETDAGMDGACGPKDDDTLCQACQKANCCDAYELCFQNDHCICIVTCMGEGHTVDTCTQHCGADSGQNHDLMGCSANQCGDMGCP